jgi:predicted TPR repeat methyltransferase
LKRLITKLKIILSNNLITNNLAILLGFENKLKSSNKMWNSFLIDPNKSLQENVGFSHREDVEEALNKAHKDLRDTVNSYVPLNGSILDIGCGTGLYLKDFYDKSYDLNGIDLSEEMIKQAKLHLPKVNFTISNFISLNLPKKFNLIYSISVLEYIGRSELDLYFKKLFDSLVNEGIIFIHYPHALAFIDTIYPDLNYIKYQPKVISKIASKYFTIIRHEHCFDGRIIQSYDRNSYPSVNGTFKNGYLLIARKK